MNTFNPYALRSFTNEVHSEIDSRSNYKLLIARLGSVKGMLKAVVCLLFIVILVSCLFIFQAKASSTDTLTLSEGEQLVTVSSGDTLWGIASRYREEGENTGYLVFLIKNRNDIKSDIITPGQQFVIPHR